MSAESNRVLNFARKATPLLLLLSLLLIEYSIYLTFMSVPSDRSLGDVQRILYFHAGTATAAYLSIGICLMAALIYLVTESKFWDALQVAAAEVGFLLCTIVLVTGMIWGHSSWNTIFRFEPRLVSFLMLWMVFLTFVLLRQFGKPELVANHSAVLAILGALLVPVMIYSIKLLPAASQLHPEVVSKGGLTDPRFKKAFFVSMGSLCLFQFALVALRLRLAVLRQKVFEQS